MTTTDVADEARRDALARKVARVHGLRDPLGAKGFRVTSTRIERETRARRAISIAAFASFVACFGLVTIAAGDSRDDTATRPVTADTRPAFSASAPKAAPTPHLRTRAT